MEPVVIEIKLENEYSHRYGTLWLIFCERPEDAQEWIKENLDSQDGVPYWHNQDVWSQTRTKIVSFYDHEGNASRDAWWLLLEAFAKKEIGPSILKKIARLAQWWPPE